MSGLSEIFLNFQEHLNAEQDVRDVSKQLFLFFSFFSFLFKLFINEIFMLLRLCLSIEH